MDKQACELMETVTPTHPSGLRRQARGTNALAQVVQRVAGAI